MIYLLMFGLAIVLMLPLLVAMRKGRDLRGRRETALAMHRAQLTELTRDLADGRIAEREYEGARLEVERRLLSADALSDPKADGNAKFLLLATALAIPVMAFALYLPGSTPTVPSEPHAAWIAKEQSQQRNLGAVADELRAKLATLDPNSVAASEGQAYLAEILAEQAQQITPESLALFKQSLAHAPPNAAWRPLAAQRVAQAQAAGAGD
jgi:cytochrome c-type biogenesis protein CcmH